MGKNRNRWLPLLPIAAMVAVTLHAQTPASAHEPGMPSRMSHGEAHSDDHDAHEDVNIGYIPRDVLQLPISLRNNIGHVSNSVTTKNADAQTFYNQGVAYLHSYVWIDAARSFNQALRLDPDLALAHMGLFRVFLNLDDLPA